MNSLTLRLHRRRAFTLVELLVVVAIVALLAGTVGLNLRSLGENTALQAAQATVASLCSAARGRAALTGRNARLLLAADPADIECHLRYLQIVHEDPAGSDRWLAEGSGVYLPRGVYVVPPAGAAVPGNPGWPASRRSTALSATPERMAINGVAAGACHYVQFSPRGTTTGGNLLLGSGHAITGTAGTVLVLENADNVRGVLLRPSGALTLINDARAFPP